jgi:Glutaredoxin and related proteins
MSDTEPLLTVYTVPNCLDCAAVKHLLAEAGVPFREVDISFVPGSRDALELLSGRRSVPQVYLGARFLGQVGEIRYLVRTGRLQQLLAGEAEAAAGEAALCRPGTVTGEAGEPPGGTASSRRRGQDGRETGASAEDDGRCQILAEE